MRLSTWLDYSTGSNVSSDASEVIRGAARVRYVVIAALRRTPAPTRAPHLEDDVRSAEADLLVQNTSRLRRSTHVTYVALLAAIRMFHCSSLRMPTSINGSFHAWLEVLGPDDQHSTKTQHLLKFRTLWPMRK